MYAQWLAEAMDWPEEQLRMLAFGARLHDIGKVIVPDHILKKPGDLTPEEWDMMKQHPVTGAKIVGSIKHLKGATNYVLYHHERWDGSGYPNGLQGREIPVEGRLLAIADVYDALTTDRPYHPARPRAEVTRYLEQRAGVHFDPDMVPFFLQALDEKMRV
jgi:putative two-component system response regulator